MSNMKILFMGTPDFAVPCLEAIYNSNHNLISVITQPDRPKGRGKKVLPPPVKKKALEMGKKVLQPLKIKDKDFINTIKEMDLDCIVVVAYGQILPKEILEAPKKGCINVHASLLPKYRGAAPINWAIINGEKYTGITTMFMEAGLDTGDMILKETMEISDQMTAGELHDKLSIIGADILLKTLDLLENNSAPKVSQDDSKSTYASMLSKETGLIDWSKSAWNLHNLIRGLNPWPIAYTMYKGDKVKIWKSKCVDLDVSNRPGEIVKVDKEGIYVNTGDKVLLISEIQFPNSRKMTVDEYIRGNEIQVGVKLGEQNAGY